MTVTIYTTSWCPYCHMAKRYLTAQGVPYSEIDIEQEGITREDLYKITQGRTVPQIIIDEKPIGGYDNMMALVQSGELNFN